MVDAPGRVVALDFGVSKLAAAPDPNAALNHVIIGPAARKVPSKGLVDRMRPARR